MLTENTKLGKDFPVKQYAKHLLKTESGLPTAVGMLKNPGWFNMRDSQIDSGYGCKFNMTIYVDNSKKVISPEKPVNVPFSEKYENAVSILERICETIKDEYNVTDSDLTRFCEIVVTADYDSFHAFQFNLKQKKNYLTGKLQNLFNDTFYSMGVFKRKLQLVANR